MTSYRACGHIWAIPILSMRTVVLVKRRLLIKQRERLAGCSIYRIFAKPQLKHANIAHLDRVCLILLYRRSMFSAVALLIDLSRRISGSNSFWLRSSG